MITNRDKKIKTQTTKTFYDSSDMCLKTLVSKIDNMIKYQTQSYENILDELNKEEKKPKKKKCLYTEYGDSKKENYQRLHKKNDPRLLNEYGIMKYCDKKGTNKENKKKLKEKRGNSASNTKSSRSKSKHSKKPMKM